MTALTFVPEHRRGWWGGQDTRVRCADCGKVVFPDIDGNEFAVFDWMNPATRLIARRYEL